MSSSREVIVGLSVAVTGSLSRHGRQALDGARLWASYINQVGGIAISSRERRAVRLVWFDDESRIERARQNVSKLLTDERVDLLLGPYGSATTLAVADVADRNGKILWNHGGSSDEIFSHGFRRLVAIASPASDYLRALPRWLATSRPSLRRIAIVHPARGTFGAQVARGVVEAATAAGEFVTETVRYEPGAAIQALDEIRRLAPEVLVLAGRFDDDVLMMQARWRWPACVRQTAAVAAGIRAFWEELGDEAEGVIGCSQWEPTTVAADVHGPDSQWFMRSFRARFGGIPEYTAAASFAAGLVASECIRRAQSLDDDRLRAVADALDLTTFAGRFRIDPATGRQIGHRVLLIRWRAGRKIALDVPPL